ncbi:MAG: glutathione S-transferase N-terminal domain-containing protein [Gammaproteobacteria bacterium]|nr:glutathione S-transferase N-terminal domain-containing protein [Gammaproteobacteria bacterium]MCZ6826289.1 glutathione S-transferase N-terminal domain-containing protein [Gammaproteobacteria bacterium]
MALVANRRSVMTLFSKSVCAQSHRARIVLAEKGINVDLIDVEGPELPEDLLDLNPYHSLPTLVDRELVLYDSRVIMEYLDERFPHPPLMPVDPVSRAHFRLALFRIEKDWYELADKIESSGDTKSANQARKQLKESLLSSGEIFATKPFFISDDFSLVDCTVAPILWRLQHFGIELPGNVKPILQYMDRVFSRPSFQASLSELEQEMRM